MGETLAIGPPYMLKASGFVAAVRYSGTAFKVFDAAGDYRGTFAIWSATRAAVLGLAAEWEAGGGSQRSLVSLNHATYQSEFRFTLGVKGADV